MANLIGSAKNDSLSGTDDPDVIFGDPFTTGAAAGGFPGFPDLGVLAAGKGGNDMLRGGGGKDSLFGDAWEITDTGRGGNDTLDGGTGENALYGDAFTMSGKAIGGNDTFLGGTGANVFIGDALSCPAPRSAATTRSSAETSSTCSSATRVHVRRRRGRQ